MDRFETLVRDALTEGAHGAPSGDRLIAALTREHPRRWVAPLAAAVVALLVTGLVIALRWHQGTDDRSAVDVQRTTTRWASFHEVSVAVPASLPTRTTTCGGQFVDEVVAITAQDTSRWCPAVGTRLSPHPGTVVWLGRQNRAWPYSGITTVGLAVAGDATARQGHSEDGRSGVVLLPRLGLVVGVTAPSPAAVDAILGTLRIGSVDPLGCAVRQQNAAAGRISSTSELVPANPSSAVWCVYADSGSLTRSYRLDASLARRLRTALNALRPDPCRCAHGGTFAPGYGETIRFDYSSEPSRLISGNHGANLDTFSDGYQVVADYGAVITTMLESTAP